MDLGLKDRVVVVTGGSQGIGQAIAERFGREGAFVAITYCNHEDKAKAVIANIRQSGVEGMTSHLDLGSSESIRSSVESILARWGKIDILINNAVNWGPRTLDQALPFDQLPAREWQDLLRSNLEGTYTTIQTVLPAMRKRRWGRIVNISSGVAVDGMAGCGWYATVKSGIHGMTRTLSKEFATEGILVNVVMPGPTLTERVRRNFPALGGDRSSFRSPIRQLLVPEDIAPLVVFLSSTVNTKLTGEIIYVNGGASTPDNVLKRPSTPEPLQVTNLSNKQSF